MPDEPKKPKWPKSLSYSDSEGEWDAIDSGMTIESKRREKLGGIITVGANAIPAEYWWTDFKNWLEHTGKETSHSTFKEWILDVRAHLLLEKTKELQEPTMRGVWWCNEILKALDSTNHPAGAALAAYKVGAAVTEYRMRRQFEIEVRRSKSSIEGAQRPRGPRNPLVAHVQTHLPGWEAIKPCRIRMWLIGEGVLEGGDVSGWEATRKALSKWKTRPKKPAP